MEQKRKEGVGFVPGLRVLGMVLWISQLMLGSGCRDQAPPRGAAELLGNPEVLAMSYSGWRTTRRAAEWCPTVAEIKEDLLLMEALGVRLIRTYNTQLYPQTARILEAIDELRAERTGFEMQVMLGAWIQCEGAYTDATVHTLEDSVQNAAEITEAIRLARAYPETVKIIAVGNEAMVHWQPHHVAPGIIHKWVRVLREARAAGDLAGDLWITTSDNWAALGGETAYQSDELVNLLRDLDFVSLHTYAFHDSYYYPDFKWADPAEADLPTSLQKERAVARALAHQKQQVAAVRSYLDENGIDLAIHIGETGWATRDDSHYGPDGTRVADEFTSKLFHDAVREWTAAEGMSCFYFQAIDEPWKSSTPDGSESHFGLFTNEGKAKAVIWDLVDAGAFEGLGRNGQPVTKTYGGDPALMMQEVLPPKVFKHGS